MTFSNPAIDPDFETEFNQRRTAKAWIIDLRWNGGGSSEIGYRHLGVLYRCPDGGQHGADKTLQSDI